jgi:endonuclease YncB( thermonuclease family)
MRAVLILGVAATLLVATPLRSGEAADHRLALASVARIEYAVDGDTLRVELGHGSRPYVRLVGIDTPEDVQRGAPVECGSRAAATSLRRLAPEGAEVVLRPDSVADEYDHYGRLLAHAFVGGRQLEVLQLRRGWAEVYRYHRQRFDGLARFRAAEASAHHARLGVWGRCGGDFHSGR